jgi:hypothetical protein
LQAIMDVLIKMFEQLRLRFAETVCNVLFKLGLQGVAKAASISSG